LHGSGWGYYDQLTKVLFFFLLLEAKNGFRRAFKRLNVKRYGKGDKDGSTGFYERFRGFFIGGLGAKIRHLLGVIY